MLLVANENDSDLAGSWARGLFLTTKYFNDTGDGYTPRIKG